MVDVTPSHEAEFLTLATAFEALLISKGFGRTELVRDEAYPHRFYSVRHWRDAEAAERCHADPEVQALTARLSAIARISHVVNGTRPIELLRVALDDRRARVEADRRIGFDRRGKNVGNPMGAERRQQRDRRLGPRRLHERSAAVDLIAAARRARENADAAYSRFKVGAALETADAAVITGCNIENATY